jgi:Putative Na+/H+ antiporter
MQEILGSYKIFIEKISTAFLLLALIHTFTAPYVLKYSYKYPNNSVRKNFLHFLGEVEVVFGFWATLFLVVCSVFLGSQNAVNLLQTINFTEPVFVFVIMCMASTRPVLQLAETCINFISNSLGFIVKNKGVQFYFTALTIGPLLGSLITEPAAMTILALVLKNKIFDKNVSEKLKYSTLALLFLNISIGGTLTHFAAPPVLLAAKAWEWNSSFVFFQFGLKSVFCIFILTAFFCIVFKNELRKIFTQGEYDSNHSEFGKSTPFWLKISHVCFLCVTILYHSYIAFFVAVFLLFVGWCDVTRKYQDTLKVRESLLVGFFLAGLVVLGSFQSWWLAPLLEGLPSLPLFGGAALLSALTDNAAVVYLGTQVTQLTSEQKYLLVAGAVSAGGLTVIANAPNPAGFGILSNSFQKKGSGGISHFKLFLYALVPTLFVMAVFAFA